MPTSRRACAARPSWCATAACSGRCTACAASGPRAPGLLTDILAALDGVDPDEREARTGRRTAYLSGIAAATAAGAAGAIVFATRVRHRRPLAG